MSRHIQVDGQPVSAERSDWAMRLRTSLLGVAALLGLLLGLGLGLLTLFSYENRDGGEVFVLFAAVVGAVVATLFSIPLVWGVVRGALTALLGEEERGARRGGLVGAGITALLGLLVGPAILGVVLLAAVLLGVSLLVVRRMPPPADDGAPR